ncbi:LytTR family DNA-binding domain-containing protein [Sinanaerobacter chloroacetimidivorans]|nr:LytTR family DNA-binding domain-containing protein [Sinanaerobacter chloroacetimidivorans]
MNIFNSKYLENKYIVILLPLITAVIIVATDTLMVPVGYLINYAAIIILFSLLLKINIMEVFFEFLFSSAIILLFQTILIYISSNIGAQPMMTRTEIAIHLLLILIVSIVVGRNRKLQLKVRPFYRKYKIQTELIAVNLFVLSIICLYIWDTDLSVYNENIIVITAITLLWFVLNAYLLKKLTDDYKQKKIIALHEQNILMSKDLINTSFEEMNIDLPNEMVKNKDNEKGKMVFFTTDEGEILVNIEEIYYAEKKHNYCLLHTSSKVLRLIGISLKEVMDTINVEFFIKCHKFLAINMKKIDGIRNLNNKQYAILLKDKKESVYLDSKYYQELICKYKHLVNKEGEEYESL